MIYRKISAINENYKRHIQTATIVFWLFMNLFLFGALYFNAFGVGLIQMFQFNALILLLLYLFRELRCNRWLMLVINLLIIIIYLVLLLYDSLVHEELTFDIIRVNILDINDIIRFYGWYLVLILSLGLMFTFLSSKIQAKITSRAVYIILFFLLAISTLAGGQYQNKLFVFAETINTKDVIVEHYQARYADWQADSRADKEVISRQVKAIDRGSLPKYLDNIVFLHLEALNSTIVSQNYTPSLIKIAEDGMLFSRFYGNSVQTILAQENVLCSLPSSFYLNLVQTEESKMVLCLPEILKMMGYKNFFYKSDNSLNFARTGEFMRDLLFDQIFAGDDFMPQDSPEYEWGYREDVYYQNVIEDLADKKQDKYNFVYIAVSSTNHWPFKTPEEYEQIVPFEEPSKFKQRLTNTTFLQDRYLGVVWDAINNIWPEKNYTVIIFGDHAWPAGEHDYNVYNMGVAFEENFLTTMVVVVGDEEKYRNKIVETKHSQMDILPSVLDLFGLELNSNNFRQSFFDDIKQTKTILIQPYSDKYLNVIEGKLKYQYNIKDKVFRLFDLATDPGENYPQVLSDDEEYNLKIVKKLLE